VGLGDLPVFIDDVGDAAGVLVFRGFRGAVGEADLAFGVAEKRKGEVELLRERGVLFLVVEADAEDLGVLRFILRREVPEPGTLTRSTGCVGLRIEPEDDLLPAQIAETHAIAVVIGHVEIRSSVARLQHARFSSSE